jgi:protein-S-isoprenylcysteine O-methyltransferase Ste14
MKAEIIFFGKRIDMAAQSRRRWLVVLIYAGLMALMVIGWFLDHWRTTGTYVLFAAFLANYLFLGGNTFGGLIKPFNGKAPRQTAQPSDLQLLKLYLFPKLIEPESNAFRNDERELRQRDYAHYLAFQAICVAVSLIWLVSASKISMPRLFSLLPISTDLLLYGLALVTVLLALTLPQAILLWTEPDMEAEG